MLVVAVRKYNDSPEVRRSFNKPTRALGFEGSYNKIPSRKAIKPNSLIVYLLKTFYRISLLSWPACLQYVST